MKIYVIEGQTGENINIRRWLVKAFSKKSKAKVFLNKINKESRKNFPKNGFWSFDHCLEYSIIEVDMVK